MSTKKPSLIFKFIKWLVRLFYPKIQIIGTENLPDEPAIIVGNHTQMNGPIIGELYFSEENYIWCAGQMMNLKDVPAYAYQDFWLQKPKFSRPFYKLLSYIIAPLSVVVFNNARTIAVWRDTRILSTFRTTVKRLGEGKSIIIFPECGEEHNHIINNFQDKFIDMARFYHKKSGKELCFVPMYIAPKLKKVYLGKPIRFCAENDMDSERERIRSYLMQEITEIACALPRHTVVPYRNIPKKYYPTNIPDEVSQYEKTGR